MIPLACDGAGLEQGQPGRFRGARTRDLGPWPARHCSREMRAVTIADQIEDHQARCLPHMLRLRMLARDDAQAALPWQAVLEVIQATEAIQAEAEAAGRDARDARAAAEDDRGAGTFLSVRLTRLTAAADDPVPAAGRGDFAQL